MPDQRMVYLIGSEDLGRVWADRDGDVWSAHPTIHGSWEVAYARGSVSARGDGTPKREFGPYTEVLADA